MVTEFNYRPLTQRQEEVVNYVVGIFIRYGFDICTGQVASGNARCALGAVSEDVGRDSFSLGAAIKPFSRGKLGSGFDAFIMDRVWETANQGFWVGWEIHRRLKESAPIEPAMIETEACRD